MDRFREYDVVEVVQLLAADRPYEGSEGVARAPRVGDRGAVVHLLEDRPEGPLMVECVEDGGYTVWLAQFTPAELRLLQRPG